MVTEYAVRFVWINSFQNTSAANFDFATHVTKIQNHFLKMSKVYFLGTWENELTVELPFEDTWKLATFPTERNL